MTSESRSCRPWRATVLITVFSLVCTLASLESAHAALYRWVDANGRVHYSDTLPPTYQKSGAAELNKQGLVIKRTQSEAERRAGAEARAEAERKKREADEQTRLDRALASTYTTEAEIDLARDRALEYHQLAIHSAEMRAKAVDANLKGLDERIERIRKAGKPVSANLQSQLGASEKESLELKRTILQHQEAMVNVREKYEADKQRFRQLQLKAP